MNYYLIVVFLLALASGSYSSLASNQTDMKKFKLYSQLANYCANLTIVFALLSK